MRQLVWPEGRHRRGDLRVGTVREVVFVPSIHGFLEPMALQMVSAKTGPYPQAIIFETLITYTRLPRVGGDSPLFELMGGARRTLQHKWF